MTRWYLPPLLVAIAAGAAAQEPRPAGPPDSDGILTRAGATAPFFISAAAATSAAGTIDWTVFLEGDRAALQTGIAVRQSRVAANDDVRPDAGCPTKVITFDHIGRGRTWSELRDGAKVIYRGRVSAVTPGFRSAAPASLVTIEIDALYRTAPGFPARGIIQIITSAADFSIGGERFCNAGEHGGFIPQRGDEILLAASAYPIDSAGTFIPTSDLQAIFARENTIVPPAALARDETFHGLTLEDLGRDRAQLR